MEIKYWFDLKMWEFVEVENRNPKFSTNDWLARYIHDGAHEWFFYEFPIILYEFPARFTYKKNKHQGGESTSWTPKLIQELWETDNKASWAVKVWMDSIVEGYITEFAVDTNKSFSKVEREFFSRPRGRFLLSLQLSIKKRVYEKCILKMEQE